MAMILADGTELDAGERLEQAVAHALERGVGILEEGYERGRHSWWLVQSLSGDAPHRVSAIWLDATNVKLHCDCPAKRAIACQHRGAVAQQWALQVAHEQGKHSAVLNRCPLCGSVFVVSHEAEADDPRREERWSVSPFAPRSGREVRLSLAAQAQKSASQDAPQGRGDAPGGEVHSRAARAERPRQQAHSASERPYVPPADLSPEMMRRNALDVLAARRDSSIVARPLVPVGIFK